MTELDTTAIRDGDAWERENGCCRPVEVGYVEHQDIQGERVPMFIMSLWPTWDINYFWHGGGLCHWAKSDDDKEWLWLCTAKQVRKALMKNGYTKLVRDKHICVMPNDQMKPPDIIRNLFGRITECNEEAGINPEPFKTLASR